MLRIGESFALFALLAVSSIAFAVAHPFTITGRFDATSTAYGKNGSVPLDVREIRFDAKRPNGDLNYYRLLIEFAPSSGNFFWVVIGEDADSRDESRQIRALKNDRIAIVHNNCLANLLPERDAALYVRETCGHAASLDDAESIALSAAAKLNNPPGRLERPNTWRKVKVDGLGTDFLVSPDSAAPPSAGPRITEVKWDGKHWVVTLQGRWQEQVVLSENYDVISHKKIE